MHDAVVIVYIATGPEMVCVILTYSSVHMVDWHPKSEGVYMYSRIANADSKQSADQLDARVLQSISLLTGNTEEKTSPQTHFDQRIDHCPDLELLAPLASRSIGATHK